MSNLYDDSEVSKEIREKSNIFYDTFAEVKEYYSKHYDVEMYEEAATICIADTGPEVGLYDQSDIIAVYDFNTHLPVIVTERIYKRNFSPHAWRLLIRSLKAKVKVISSELGFNVRISFASNYVDYVHYKEEWWQWALKHKELYR